jgi:ATP-dependent helicase HrpB
VEAVCADATLLKHLRGREVLPCLLGLTPLEESALVERLAPDSFEVPTGQRARVHYEVGRPPYISVYLQSFLGTSEHPRLGGVVPLQLHLLSPAQRPLQITSDLPSFWRSGYLDVRRELRARYPKHHWPEDPLSVAPQRGAKKRF